ncbi:MAG: matrixin family metalloprotease [Nanoarchaeota archaeon]
MTKEENSSTILKIINILIIIFLISLILILSYYIYINFPREPELLKIINNPSFEPVINSEVKQFYPNMKFNHNKISYFIDISCDEERKSKMGKAFVELSKKVSEITFYSNELNPDIEITCSKNNEVNIDKKHFVAGEGGAKEIIQTGNYNVITKGIILLYENTKIRSKNCDYPNIELHELLHVLGFDHSESKKSIMYTYIESCDQVLDNSIINQLKELYSKENLPDLYFENIEVTKKGIYLDFILTTKNSGSIKADNIILTIMDDDIIIHEKNLGDFDFGAGITLKTKDLKLERLNPDKINFILDKENKINELNEENNIIEIKLD